MIAELISEGVADIDGVRHIIAARAPEYLGVRADRVRDWQRRGLVVGVMWRGRRWYPLPRLQNVEAGTRNRTRPRLSGCDLTATFSHVIMDHTTDASR